MGKRLVAFFSASGTTKRVAEMIASAVDADMGFHPGSIELYRDGKVIRQGRFKLDG